MLLTPALVQMSILKNDFTDYRGMTIAVAPGCVFSFLCPRDVGIMGMLDGLRCHHRPSLVLPSSNSSSCLIQNPDDFIVLST